MEAESPGWSGTVRAVRQGNVLEERCVGPVAGPDGPLCGSDTRYQAGSIGKLVLAAAVLRLVEQGELDLGRPISRWVATVPAPWGVITLHHLLSHTSGIGHWGDLPGLGHRCWRHRRPATSWSSSRRTATAPSSVRSPATPRRSTRATTPATPLLAYLPGLDMDLAALCNEEAPSVDTALRDLASV